MNNFTKNYRRFVGWGLYFMKISALPLFLLGWLASVSVALPLHSQELLNRRVSIKVEKTSLKEVLEQLKKQSDVRFSFNSKQIDVNTPVSLAAVNEPLGQALDKLLGPLAIGYTAYSRLVVLRPLESEETKGKHTKVEDPEPLRVVTGRVTDEKGEALPGVNVLVKGTQQGVITNVDGAFSIDTPDDKAVLVFSFVGYVSEEVTVGDRVAIDVSLKVDEKSLEEVVVVGYGSKTKKEVTGAIGTMQGDVISEQAVTGFDQAMAGRIAGVQIVQNSASPGGGSSIRVRGVGTPGVSEPLYVIDGVPVFDASVSNMINPNDIQSIDILKDAASSAIYGARGANGVVIITTKQGVKGPVKVDMNYYYGVQSFEKRFDMLDASEYKDFLNARKEPFTDGSQNVNWLNEITAPAPMQNFNMNIKGGSESTTYFLSTDFLDQKGIVKGTDFKRFTTRININSKINRRIKMGTNLTFGKSWRNTRAENSLWSLLGAALYYPPIVPIRESGGQYGDAAEYLLLTNSNNPLALVEVGSYKSNLASALGNFFTEIEPLKGLVYKINLGFNYKSNVSDNYFPGYIYGVKNRRDGVPSISKGLSNETIWLIENTLTYKFSVRENHHINLLVGATQQEANNESLSGQRLNSVSKDPTLVSLNSSPSVTHRADGGFGSWSLASFLGRIDYNYKGKYLLTATVRRDGSSKFAPGNQWGTFPSVSGAWIVSDESFFNAGWIANLKLRASWGKLGNQEIAAFQYLSTLGSVTYLLGDNTVGGVFPNNVANRMITWETSKQTNVGFDMDFFNNRLTLSVDYFDKQTDGILLSDPISSVYGYTDAGGNVINSTKNAGVIANKGLEFNLGYRSRNRGVKWSANANAATLKNEVMSLGGGAPLLNSMNNGQYSTKTDVGGQIGAFYGKVVEGVGEDGHFVFAKDADGQDIQTNIGNPIPRLTYGLNGRADYKNFDCSMAFQGVAGNDIYAASLFQTGNFSYSTNNVIKSIYDQAGKTAPSLEAANGADYAGSSWFVYNGAYLRLRSVQLGYTVPLAEMKKWGVDRIRFYITGQNLFTIDKYKVGLNPEVGAFNQNNVSAGVDQVTYPTARVLTAGINLSF